MHLAGLLANIFDPLRQTSKAPTGGFVWTPACEAVAAISTNLQRKVEFNKSRGLAKIGFPEAEITTIVQALNSRGKSDVFNLMTRVEKFHSNYRHRECFWNQKIPIK